MSAGSKDGAWRADGKQAAGVDAFGNEHVLNTDLTGTLEVDIVGAALPPGQVVPVAIDQTGDNNDVDVISYANVDKNFGTWSYYAGASGTVTVTAGQRVLGIAAHATNAGTVTINGGPTVILPAGVSWELEPLGNLVAPTVVFTNTDTYFIEVVS